MRSIDVPRPVIGPSGGQRTGKEMTIRRKRRSVRGPVPTAAAAFLAFVIAPVAWAGDTLRINGSSTVNPIVAEAAEILRREMDMRIQVDVQGGSSGGVVALGDGRAEIAMSSKPLDAADRAKYPAVRFHEVAVGYDSLALVTSRDVWEGGVRALSREQVRQIYEGKVKNWREFGGPDRRIAFFNKEPGRGTWKVFASWLYGSEQPPLVSFPEVGANEEARSKVGSTRGALTQLSASWADGDRVFALGIRSQDGKVIEPTAANAASGAYPLRRPLLLITDGEPRGLARILIDFALSPRGQVLVEKHGYMALDASVVGQ